MFVSSARFFFHSHLAILVAAEARLSPPPPPPPTPVKQRPPEMLWKVGMQYSHLPGLLSPVSDRLSDHWYAVTRGTHVGVFLNSYVLSSRFCSICRIDLFYRDITSYHTNGYSHASNLMRKSQRQAIKIFNTALAEGQVVIIPHVPKCPLSPLIFSGNDSDLGKCDVKSFISYSLNDLPT